ncbi:MAG: hypothetical protein WCH76_02810 [Candidatus Riflemargulisbacteria bacterium]
MKWLNAFWKTVSDIRNVKISRQTLIIILVSAFIILFIILCTLLIVGGCRSKTRAIEEAKPKLENVRGYVYHGPEVSVFRKCDGAEEYWVTGDVDIILWKVYADLAPEEYLPVYVEMKVQFLKNEEGSIRSDYAGQVLVKEVYHMSYDSQGCELAKNYNYLLQGNEPSWKISIDEKRGILFQESGQPEVYASYVSPKEMDNGIVFNLISGSSPMVIKIRKIDTYDNISGAYYAYSAFVSFKDKDYYGQALVGNPLF